MAKIKVISKCELYDGMSITFRAPCDCTVVDGLNVYYNEYSQSFSFRDAHGNNLAGLEDMFSEGAYIKAILDTRNGYAYLQNTDTNAYLQERSYTKEETLTDETKSALGLSSSAVPADVLCFLGKYNLHWWKMRSHSAHYEAYVSESITDLQFSIYNLGSGTTYYYSDAITVSQTDGKLSLVNPESVLIKYGKTSNYSLFVGKYVSGGAYQDLNEVYKIPDDARIQSSGAGDYTKTTFFGVSQKIIGLYMEETGEWEYVYSLDPNAYPKGGVVDGYEYQYFGIPLENAIHAPIISAGSYVGTGTYGANNPNTLTFDFAPKVVVLFNSNGGLQTKYGSGTSYEYCVGICDVLTTEYNERTNERFWGGYASDGGGNVIVRTQYKKSEDGKTIIWQNIGRGASTSITADASASAQYNSQNTTYYYFAIA